MYKVLSTRLIENTQKLHYKSQLVTGNDMKHVNTVCKKNTMYLKAAAGGTCSDC
jgi:hypothetical protein